MICVCCLQAVVIDLEKKKFVRKVCSQPVCLPHLLLLLTPLHSISPQIGDEASILPSKLFQYLEHSLVRRADTNNCGAAGITLPSSPSLLLPPSSILLPPFFFPSSFLLPPSSSLLPPPSSLPFPAEFFCHLFRVPEVSITQTSTE